MSIADKLVLPRQQHLKWRAFDWLELVLMMVCGALCFGFSLSVMFGIFRLPSGTPIASLYAAIPVSGVLIALFTVEQLVNGIRNGFDHPEPEEELIIPSVETSLPRGTRP